MLAGSGTTAGGLPAGGRRQSEAGGHRKATRVATTVQVGNHASIVGCKSRQTIRRHEHTKELKGDRLLASNRRDDLINLLCRSGSERAACERNLEVTGREHRSGSNTTGDGECSDSHSQARGNGRKIACRVRLGCGVAYSKACACQQRDAGFVGAISESQRASDGSGLGRNGPSDGQCGDCHFCNEVHAKLRERRPQRMPLRIQLHRLAKVNNHKREINGNIASDILPNTVLRKRITLYYNLYDIVFNLGRKSRSKLQPWPVVTFVVARLLQVFTLRSSSVGFGGHLTKATPPALPKLPALRHPLRNAAPDPATLC